MKYKYTFHPKRYKLGEMERFYSDMAAKGFHLVKRGIWLSKFSKSEPKDMKYRVEVVCNNKSFRADKMPREQLAVYEDCGWDFVCNDVFVHIFRAPQNSDTEEFYIDPAQQAETLKGMRNHLFMSALQVPAQILVYSLLNVMMGANIMDLLTLAFMINTYDVMVFALFIFLCIWESIYGTIHLSLLYLRMKKGTPLNHSPKSKAVTFIPILPLLILLSFCLTIYGFTKNDVIVPLDKDAPYLTFYDLGYGESDLKSEKSGHSYIKSPFGQYWEADINSGENGTKWMTEKVFVLNNPKHSRKVAKAFMNTSIFAQSRDKFIEIPVDGLDKVYIAKQLECVAVKDNKVMIITTTMDKKVDTEKILAAVAQKWANYP